MKNKKMAAGIYVHIPFCVRKCSYCDFYSEPVRLELLERYISSLVRETRARAQYWSEQEFDTIYLGGGTPSLLSSAQIEMVLETITANYHISSLPEISMEANPATINLQSLREIQAAGVNRLSLGVQSFRDKELKILGRIHGSQEIWDTVHALNAAGIMNYNLDLIYGIPGQTLEDWTYNLRMAVQCHPQHISAYLLQLDPATQLAQAIQTGNVKALDEDVEAGMFYSCVDYLSSQGYHHYEISNYAKPGYECRHNIIYWQAREYLGLGAGAVSYHSSARTMNPADLNGYLQATDEEFISESEVLETMNSQEKLADAVILGLRMTSGIIPSELSQRFGIDFKQEYHAIIEKLKQNGLLTMEEDKICLTRQGYFLSNQVFSQFI